MGNAITDKYKIYRNGNYIVIGSAENCGGTTNHCKSTYYGGVQEVTVIKNNAGRPVYNFLNVNNFNKALKLDQMLKEDCTPYTEAEFDEFYTQNTEVVGSAGVLLQDILDEIILIKKELENDDSFQLFEDTDGNVLWGVRADDGSYTYFTATGAPYTGDVKPYSRQALQTITDYCSNLTPYSLIQIRDADTKTILVSIWRNDLTLVESQTAPANVTKGVCVVPPPQEIDKVVTNWLPICVDTEVWYTAEHILFNNVTQTETVVKVYKKGADGIIETTTPTGVITEGYCKDCTEKGSQGTILNWNVLK